MRYFLFTLLAACIFSCTPHNEATELEAGETFWVNSFKVDCSGVGKQSCLQINRSSELTDVWEMFYTNIEGFEYEPGFIYRIEVERTELEAKNTPADASSFTYKLINVISKEADARFAINDIWVLEDIEGQAIEANDKRQVPTLEVQIAANRVAGNAGCNNYFGDVDTLSATNFKVSEQLGTTMKACMDMELEGQFLDALAKVRSYNVAELKLYLYDAEKNELLRFKKAD